MVDFRVFHDAAPLKPGSEAGRRYPIARFPRLSRRGPIEACYAVDAVVDFLVFPRLSRRGPIEACYAVDAVVDFLVFPRLSRRGPIEADDN